MTRDIKVFEDNPAVAKAFADYLVNFTSGRSKTTIALSGGSTPKLLFGLLAKDYHDKIDWKKATLMGLVHDIAESLVGDYFSPISSQTIFHCGRSSGTCIVVLWA